MKKVVAYCRVSTDHDNQKDSIENQRLFFEEYVAKHEDWELIHIYADEGITGTSLKKRNDFNRMYRNALSGECDIILTKEVCRFARNTVDTLDKTRQLKRVGIEVHFIIDNIKTFDGDAELRLGIMATLAQDESRRTSERVQFGLKQTMKKGVALGNIVYGYDFVRDEITGKKTKLVINEKEAEIVRYIFNAYLNEGKGAYTIAKELKQKGIPIKRTRSGKPSTDWRQGTILDILKNPKYVGDLKQGITYTVDFLEHIKKENKGEREFIYIRDHHPAIIDRPMFEAVQVEMERRSKMYGQEKSKYSNKHTFSGKLTCGCCGASYVGGVSKLRADGTRLRSWRCYSATAYGKKHVENGQELGCDNDRVNDEVLKLGFTKALQELIDNKNKIQENMENTLKEVLQECNDDVQIGESLLRKKEKLIKEKEKLLDLCIKEIVSEEDYKAKNKEFEDKIKEVNEQIRVQQDKQMMRENIDEILDEARKVIDNVLNIKEFSKSVCRELIDKVVIHSKTKFDYYIKGYKPPYFFYYEGNILYLQH